MRSASRSHHGDPQGAPRCSPESPAVPQARGVPLLSPAVPVTQVRAAPCTWLLQESDEGSESRAGRGLKHGLRGNQTCPGPVTLARSLTISGFWTRGDSGPSGAAGRLGETTRVMCAQPCLLHGGPAVSSRSPARRRRPRAWLLRFLNLTAPLPSDLTLLAPSPSSS